MAAVVACHIRWRAHVVSLMTPPVIFPVHRIDGWPVGIQRCCHSDNCTRDSPQCWSRRGHHNRERPSGELLVHVKLQGSDDTGNEAADKMSCRIALRVLRPHTVHGMAIFLSCSLPLPERKIMRWYRRNRCRSWFS